MKNNFLPLRLKKARQKAERAQVIAIEPPMTDPWGILAKVLRKACAILDIYIDR